MEKTLWSDRSGEGIGWLDIIDILVVRIPMFSEGRESISSFKTRITEKVQSLQHMTSVGVGSFALNWYGLSTKERERDILWHVYTDILTTFYCKIHVSCIEECCTDNKLQTLHLHCAPDKIYGFKCHEILRWVLRNVLKKKILYSFGDPTKVIGKRFTFI